MKSCPQCRIEYFDDTLEFCLEDGARLVHSGASDDEFPTIAKSDKKSSSTNAPTVRLRGSEIHNTVGFSAVAPSDVPKTVEQISSSSPEKIAEKIPAQGRRVLEIIPLILALIHNWWQWVYLMGQNYYSFSAYVFSANFLMWLLLLIAGTAVGLFSLKYSRSKGFAYAGLIVLAINLILFLVPKR
jgi:hypothetical protein